MKIPAWLWIGYRKFQVLTRNNLPNVYGSMNSSKRLIQIEAGQNADDEVNTLLHEVLHVMVEDSTLVSESYEEQIVTVLANDLTELFIRNPDLLLWIQERLEEER